LRPPPMGLLQELSLVANLKNVLFEWRSRNSIIDNCPWEL